MKWITLAGLVLLSGCIDPHADRIVDHLIRDLGDIAEWHPVNGPRPSDAHDRLVGMGEEAIPSLANALVTMKKAKTKIMDQYPHHIPTVGDVVFHILLKITGRDAAEFREMGVVVTDDSNPIFAVVVRPEAWSKLRAFFLGNE